MDIKNYEHFTKFVMGKIKRSEIQNAPYNPRTISATAKEKLKENLKKVGLLQPISWNKLTGNILSGHQRLACMDLLVDDKDSEIEVAIVELDEKTEKEQNIFMNNSLAQGEFDEMKVFELIKEDALNYENVGFTHSEAIMAFGEEILISDNEKQMEDRAKKLEEMEAIKTKVNAKKNKNEGDANTDEFYCVVVFKNQFERDLYLRAHGFPEEKYQNASLLVKR